MTTKDRAKGIPVRMPRDLRIWIGVEAAKALRSVNSEIVMRLEASRAASEASRATGAPAAGEALSA